MKLGHLLVGLFALLFLSACGEETYVYPSVKTEFADAQTDSEGVLSALITDGGQCWKVRYREGLSGLTPDSLYRTVSVYEPLLPSEEVQLYSATLIMARKPVCKEMLEGEMKTDPVDIQSIWRAGNYLNLILRVKVKDTPHRFHFIEEGISQEGGVRTLNLRLYHDRCGDYEAFEEKMYLSVPLLDYQEQLKKGDKIRFALNTYKEGETCRMFEY